jgi:hypothetical protein
MYNGLLLLVTFAWLVVLFASTVGILAWVLRRFGGMVAGSEEAAEKPRRRTRRIDQWNPDHPLFSKRAGQ